MSGEASRIKDLHRMADRIASVAVNLQDACDAAIHHQTARRPAQAARA
jgi:hypothetical protein